MILIRPYTPADYEQVQALYKTPNTFGGQFDEDRDSSARLNEQIIKDNRSILVAEEDGKIVGTVSLLYDTRFAWLIRFATLSESVAQGLYTEACQILKERGHNQVLVYAPAGNDGFANRYATLGFQKGVQDYSVYWRSLDT